MTRIFDVILSFFGLIITSPIMLLITIIGFLETGSPFLAQERLGKNKIPFVLFKFRTMSRNTLTLPSHLIDKAAVTRFGFYLRKSKLDELPQLWNVLKGEMSFVGPRPGLALQDELTKFREELGIFSMRPGITGLAQINYIDMSTPRRLAEADSEMIKDLNLRKYFLYIFLTLIGKGSGDRVRYNNES